VPKPSNKGDNRWGNRLGRRQMYRFSQVENCLWRGGKGDTYPLFPMKTETMLILPSTRAFRPSAKKSL